MRLNARSWATVVSAVSTFGIGLMHVSAQTVRASQGMNIVELQPVKNITPVEIISVNVDGKEVTGNQPFAVPAGGQWLQHLKVTVRNRTSQVIDGMTFNLRFPETGSDAASPMGYQYQWGETMLKKRNPLSSEDSSPPVSLNLPPGGTATVDLGAHYQDYSELLQSSHLGTSSPSELQLSIIVVDFANRVEWFGNRYSISSATGERSATVDPTEMFK